MKDTGAYPAYIPDVRFFAVPEKTNEFFPRCGSFRGLGGKPTIGCPKERKPSSTKVMVRQ